MKEEVDIKLLGDAFSAAFSALSGFREKRKDFIRLFVGKEYGTSNKVMAETPVNMLELAVSTYSYRLSANNPRALVTTPYRKYRAAGGTMQCALDYLSEKLNLGDCIKRCVKDAMFGMGIMKVGINDCGEPIRGFTVEGGQPYVEPISLDDFCFDTTATHIKDCQFMGNRFMVDAQSLKECGLYRNIDRLGLGDSSPSGLGSGQENQGELAYGKQEDASRYRKRFYLWEIYLPFENLIVTTDEDVQTILRVQEWTGPRSGPFHFLRFIDVPDNIMPLPPSSLWVELHIFANRIWRKIFRQTDRSKSILPVEDGNGDDAERIRTSNDGDVVRVKDPKSMKEIRFGGPDQQLNLIGTTVEAVFNRMAGNLDTVGGLSPMADTASQEAILNQNSGKRFEEMGAMVRDFARGIMKSLAWWIWTDEYVNIPLVKQLGKTLEIPVLFNNESKMGDLFDYNFDIVPYSMSDKSPESRIQALRMIMAEFYQPYANVLAEAGVQLDIRSLLRQLSEYMNLPELNSIFDYGDPISIEGGGESHQRNMVQKPPTHSVYERVSRSQKGYGQQMEAIARASAGENLQPKEQPTR